MAGRIFISYRRADSQYATDRIYDRLSAHFGSENVFMDIDDIPLGVNFRIYIDQQVSTSEIVLAVIGDHWLTAVDSEGKLRLDNPGDFVRLELEATLKQGIKLIPLFIGDVQSLPAHRLPDSLRELPMLNATRIRRGTDFERDIDKLVKGIERIFIQQEDHRQKNQAALMDLKELAINIVGQLSGFEALLIQEMRKRSQLEKQALEIEKQIKDLLRDPSKQLRADVPLLKQKVDILRDEITELSFQIEERKQENQLKAVQLQAEAAQIEEERLRSERLAHKQAEADRIAEEEAEAERVAEEKAEADRVARENADAEKFAKERAEADRVAKEKAEAERIAKENLKAERLEKQRAAAQQRKDNLNDFRTMLGKVPLWVWGAGIVFVLFAVVGLVFGPALIEQLAANPPDSTAELTNTPQLSTEPKAPEGFLEWSEAISRSAPDFVEDFLSYSYRWENEISPGTIMADYVRDTGELVIAADPAELQDYYIDLGYFGDFQLQFDLSPHIFTSGILLMVDFGVDNEKGQGNHFRLNQNGTWDISAIIADKEKKLDSGEVSPISDEETYTIRIIDKAGKIAVLVNGELLTYVENTNYGSGYIVISFQAYKAIEVAYDNILLWDLNDNDILIDPPEDQAYAFYGPVRQYLSETIPTFSENFEEYQPYWDEMQVDFSETKLVSLSQTVWEGALHLNAIEGEDYGNFRLFFPQISAGAFALQFDFNFTDSMNSGDILTTSLGTQENQGDYYPYCDFYKQNQQIWCGLNGTKGDASSVDLVAAQMVYSEIASLHTMLVIFYNGQYTSFLDGYFVGYVDGLDLYDQQISINIGSSTDRGKLDAHVDNIKFWNLDGVVYQINDGEDNSQLVRMPILEYLASSEPFFVEDFESPQAYWNSMTSYQDDQQETPLGERVFDGVVRLDSREEEMINNYWDITFPQFQESANFALEFEVNFVNADTIGAFIASSTSGSYLFNLGIQNHGLDIQLSQEIDGGEPETLISSASPFDSQKATLRFVAYQSQLAIFVNNLFLGLAEGLDIAQAPEIVIFVPAGDGVTVIELDNIQYWNLDGVELNMQSEGSSPENGFDIERTLAYINSELSPTFEDDFSQPDMIWGGTSEGLAIYSLVSDGELVITDHVEDDDWTSDHAVPGLRFPTNGLFDAANFYIEFDINQNESSVNEVGIFFRQGGNQVGGYQLVVEPSGRWILRGDDEGDYRVFSSSGNDHVSLLVQDGYFVIWLNDEPVVNETQGLAYTGNLNQIWVSGEHGSRAVFDNFSFWDLDGVVIE